MHLYQKCIFLALLLILMCTVGLLRFTSHRSTCYNWYAWNGLPESKTSPDLCSRIFVCPKFDWNNKFALFPKHAGKDTVISVYLENSSIMLPAVYKRSVATSCEPVEGVPIYRQMRDYLLANYADFIPENFFSGLQNLDYSELLRLWEFIHQDEFLLLKILPYLKTINLYFPGLLGTCSDGFVVEKIPEIIDENFILEKSWEETVSVVYGFLQLVHQLDTASVELCDVQLGNFGWDPVVGRVKVIDLDLVFFRNLLAEQLAGRKCSVDGDCAMFDCQGKCDIQSGICTNQIENNNLARVCRDIFRPAFWRKGLFTGAPLLSKPGLNELAHRCSAKMTDSEDFLQKFSELIGKSL